jgi:hypothetical protein
MARGVNIPIDVDPAGATRGESFSPRRRAG